MIEDTLIAYTLGLLSAEEEREVVRHLRAHPEDAARVRELFDTLTAFALASEPERLPEDAEARLLARIRREGVAESVVSPEETPGVPPREPKAPRRVDRTGMWAGGAVAVALLALVWVALLQPRYEAYQLTRRLERFCAAEGTICEGLRAGGGGIIGTLARLADGCVFVVLEEPPPEGRVYQAWEIVAGTPQSLGVFAGRVLDPTDPLEPESSFGISIEPLGGSPQPTTAPLVVVPL